jgi:hypothetical protein
VVPSLTAIARRAVLAVVAADARKVSQAPIDESRWIDRGGWFDPDRVARLRIGDRAMKRCSA